MVDYINALLESALVDTVIDSLILVVALVPALYLFAQFLFGEPAKARRLLGSPRLLGWLFFFCGFEIFLHIVKVPIILKLVVLIVGIVALPFVLVFGVVFAH